MSKATPEAFALYNALRERNIGCRLEAWDGYKHIDLSIPWAKIDIEIDGFQHYISAKQIEADLERSYYSATKDDFYTMHIPNTALHNNLNGVADAVAVAARNRYYRDISERENKKLSRKSMYLEHGIKFLLKLLKRLI